MVAGPLDGVLVADFGRVLAAPYATMLLGDLGAEVVKVEQAGRGDETRAWGPPWRGDDATYYLSVNRNKRSVALDLSDPGDAATAVALARRADVVVENFRPGGMDAFGLGYDQLREANPGLIYCSVTGFGAGEGAALPGYDLLVQAVGGLMSITGPGPGQPTKTGVAVVDVVTGLHATVAILAALRHREVTGEGQRVEVNLLSALLSSLVNQSTAYVAGGVVPQIMGNRHPSVAPYELLPTADDPLALAVGNDRQFAVLCVALGRPALARDPRFATNSDRVAHCEALAALLTDALAGRGAGEWEAVLTPLGVPCGPVNDLAGALALAGRLRLGAVVDVEGVPLVANPVTYSSTPVQYRRRPPHLGQHTDEVRVELGVDP